MQLTVIEQNVKRKLFTARFGHVANARACGRISLLGNQVRRQ